MSISGLVVEYIVAIDVTRVRFPADAICMGRLLAACVGQPPGMPDRRTQGIALARRKTREQPRDRSTCDVRIGTTQRAIALSALTGMCRWNRLADPGSRLMQCDRDDCVPLAPTIRQEPQIAELKASLCPAESTGAAARSEYLRGAHWNQHARIALSALASMRRWNGLVDRHKTASLRVAVCRLKV